MRSLCFGCWTFALALTAASCSSPDTGGLFGGGTTAGGGGQGSGLPTSSPASVGPTSAASSTAVASSSSGMMMMCDPDAPCDQCRMCALGSDCFFEWQFCMADKECQDFLACVETCGSGDMGCVMKCENLHQQGFMEARDASCCVEGACHHCKSLYNCNG